ncbi:MAG: hypothetical protein IKS37_03090 [Solobacterium sp.]|nr:hypothetical protein [Solobacterium sp.]
MSAGKFIEVTDMQNNTRTIINLNAIARIQLKGIKHGNEEIYRIEMDPAGVHVTGRDLNRILDAIEVIR